jgi:hypothetical protein
VAMNGAPVMMPSASTTASANVCVSPIAPSLSSVITRSTYGYVAASAQRFAVSFQEGMSSSETIAS